MTNGTGVRSHPISPLATGNGDQLGLGLAGLSAISYSPRHDLDQLNEADEHQSSIPRMDRHQPQRSSTTEAFEAAFPSIDDIEASFPSLDSLEANDAELKLLKASVPVGLPGSLETAKSAGPPSIGFEFGRSMPTGSGLDAKGNASPIPRPFPNVIPDLEGAPRPASTPANGRQGITFGSAKGQSSPRVERAEQQQPKSDKLPKPDLPISNIVTSRTLKGYLATALQILVLDVRSRDDFEARRLPIENVVCIEPIVLGRKGCVVVHVRD